MPTVREKLIAILESGPHTARELSGQMGITEKDVVDHMPHIDRSLAAKGRRLVITPAACRSCGFTFTSKRRYNRPSRCPQCRSERTDSPVFSVNR